MKYFDWSSLSTLPPEVDEQQRKVIAVIEQEDGTTVVFNSGEPMFYSAKCRTPLFDLPCLMPAKG